MLEKCSFVWSRDVCVGVFGIVVGAGIAGCSDVVQSRSEEVGLGMCLGR